MDNSVCHNLIGRLKVNVLRTSIEVLHRVATVNEYIQLCDAVGWKEYMNYDVTENSLQHSLFGVVVRDDDKTIGMGRVVGDGYIYFYIQDIAVMPEYQGQGIGQRIMKEITSYLKEYAPSQAFIGLFASAGKEAFYQKFGMNNHDGMTGMFGVVHDRQIK